MKPISMKSQGVTRPSTVEQRQVVSTQCREAIMKYLESEDLEPKHCEVMLQLVDLYGLLHPVQPSVGMTARAIRQHAKAAGLTAQKKTWRLLKRCSPLERKISSETARERARIEVQAQLYQRVRGDAVISYWSTPEDRAKHLAGRRPELEVTRFLQVGARFLQEEAGLTLDHAEECLAGMLVRSEGRLLPSRAQMKKKKDSVHTRLVTVAPLEDFDYCIAIGRDPGEDWIAIHPPPML